MQQPPQGVRMRMLSGAKRTDLVDHISSYPISATPLVVTSWPWNVMSLFAPSSYQEALRKSVCARICCDRPSLREDTPS